MATKKAKPRKTKKVKLCWHHQADPYDVFSELAASLAEFGLQVSSDTLGKGLFHFTITKPVKWPKRKAL